MIILGIIIIITAIILSILPHLKAHKIKRQKEMKNPICAKTTEAKLDALDQEYAPGLLTEQEYTKEFR